MNKKLKFTAAVLAAAVGLLCVPVLSGCSADTDFELNVDEDGNKYYVVRCSGYSAGLTGEYEIPSHYGEGEDYAPVTEIASEGFSVTGLTKITVPATVTKIGVAAFAYNNYLTEVVFADGINLELIDRGTFGECYSLKTVNVPATVKKIGQMAFYECEKLESIDLSGVEIISSNSFYGCSALSEVTLSENLTTIGDMAFCNTSITEIIIPDSVHDIVTPQLDDDGVQKKDDDGNLLYDTTYGIGIAAFYNCTSLTLAVVGSGTGTITYGAFGECTSLTTLYLPANLEEVQGAYYSSADGEYLFGHAFYNVPLTDLYFGGTEAQWEELKKHVDNTEAYQNGITSDNGAILKDDLNIYFNSVYVK